VQRRIAILLFLAVLCAGAVAVIGSDHGGGKKHAQRTNTSTTTVLGSTATSTVPIPRKPTTQPPKLPRKHQHVPGTIPPPAGDLGHQSDAVQRQELEAFLATRPELVPYEQAIWYSAHYSYSNVTAKGLAGLVWCVGFRVAACDRAQDIAAGR
jgi:hypothetical protein